MRTKSPTQNCAKSVCNDLRTYGLPARRLLASVLVGLAMAPAVTLGQEPPEACCFGLGVPCQDLPPSQCLQLGGTPQGPGSQCTVPQACCVNAVCIDNVDPLCCRQIGGTPAATTCANNPCNSCCLPDGRCVDGLSAQDCLQLNGTPNALPCSQVRCYKNWVVADDFRFDTPVPPINRIRWFGSYLDPHFRPPNGMPIDGWLIAIYRDVPPAFPCPPPPAYLFEFDFDFCGTLVNLPLGCPPGSLGFQPDGSAFVYGLIPGAVGPPGARRRVCGRIDPPSAAPCPGVVASIPIYDLISPSCADAISRPGALLLEWAVEAPFNPVPRDTGFVGCDQQRVYEYTIDLVHTCLLHNFAGPDEYDPLTCQFTPQVNRTYWISIQAEMGRSFFGACSMNCDEVPTGHSVNGEYWGWHTTPPGYHHLDDAYMGRVGMGCRPGEWVYDWMSHLHWSQPPYFPCSDDPTKSMDMAFELIQFAPPVEQVLWYQAYQPGAPPAGLVFTPPRRFSIFGGLDEFPNMTGNVQFFMLPAGCPGFAPLTGSMIVGRGGLVESGGHDTIQTQMLLLDLSSPGGTVRVTLTPSPATLGQCVGTGPIGSSFPATSYFDAYLNFDIGPACNLALQTPAPVRLNATANIYEVPPANVTYLADIPPGMGLPLVDRATGAPLGCLYHFETTVTYRGGIDVHSDTDWVHMPELCSCPGDLNADGMNDALDSQTFVNCLLLGCPTVGCMPPPAGAPLTCPCLCADMNSDGMVNAADNALFVSKLLSPDPRCP